MIRAHHVRSTNSIVFHTSLQNYYIKQPSHPCKKQQTIELTAKASKDQLTRLLHSTDSCIDEPFRKNVTLLLIAQRVRTFADPGNDTSANGYPGDAVALTTKWILPKASYGHIRGSTMVRVLKNEYFLVGVTEKLNAFLVILALVNGWDVKQMYYRKW